MTLDSSSPAAAQRWVKDFQKDSFVLTSHQLAKDRKSIDFKKCFYFAHCPYLPQKKKKDIASLCRQEGNEEKPAVCRGFSDHARNTLTGGVGASAHVRKYPLFTTSHPQ